MSARSNPQGWYLPLGSVHRRWRVLCVVSTLLLVLGTARPSLAQTSCTETSPAITDIDASTLGTDPDVSGLVTDCTALLELKDPLIGTGPGAGSLNWAADTAMDTWDGITVSGTPPRVESLLLSNKDLTGEIPALSALTALTRLSLNSNELTGEIPALSALTALQRLRLHNNELTGEIPALSALTALTQLFLYGNQLTGEIPALDTLTALTHLLLYGNQLTEGIPALDTLTALTRLSLHDNQLTGEIPALDALTALTYLSLNDNQLTEEIPALDTLTALTYLSLHNNQLTGEIPALDALTALTYLSLHNNQLTGGIPALDALTALTYLSLHDNQLTEEIPALDALTALQQLHLHNNQLTGEIPDLSVLTNLTDLYLSNNQLTESIPDWLNALPALVHLSLHDNRLTGEIPDLSALKNLTRLSLNDNQLTGGIPDLDTDERTLEWLDLDNNQLTESIPNWLNALTALVRLSLNDNQLTGEIPDLSALEKLTDLYLHNNQLEGRIPDLDTVEKKLKQLTLHNNQLTEGIPDWLNDLTALQYLYLDNNQLDGPIPDLSKLTSLRYLYLNDNQLTGSIPPTLAVPALQRLYLHNNQLEEEIPALSNLPALQQLHLHNNQLKGKIPALSNLPALQQLYLRNNQLSDPIPEELGSLSNLTQLDLRNNQLTGPIPEELGSLSNLKWLLLSGNVLLTGPIPATWGDSDADPDNDPNTPAPHPLPVLTSLYLYDTNWTGDYPDDIPQALRDKAADDRLGLRTNRRPTAPEIEATALTSGEVFTYRVEFSDRDKDVLTYHATWADGRALPATLPSNPEPGNLAFDPTDPTDPTLSGIPPPAGSIIVVTVRVTDQDDPDPPTEDNPFCHPDRTSTTNPPPLCAAVTVIVTPDSISPNRPPSAPTIPAQSATRGQAFSYTVPAFYAPDGQAVTYRYHATQADGSALPAWLAFNMETRTLSGTPSTTGSLEIRVTATDSADPPAPASATFTLTIRSPVTRPPPRPPAPRPPSGGGGGSSRDQHGNTPAQATAVSLGASAPWTASITGQINTTRDIDYFEIPAPQAGVLVVETTGGSATVGTVWQDGEELATASAGGAGQNFRLSTQVAAGPVVIAVAGTGRRTGAYTLQMKLIVGHLENPGADSFQSGIGLISGWVCAAAEVEIEIEPETGDPHRLRAAYGTERGDTEETCGDTDNGFGLLFNWNLLGDGEHTVVAYVDEVELDWATVTVTTLGAEFLWGVEGACEVADFPTGGRTVTLAWQESKQNFVLTSGTRPAGATRAGVAGVGHLENPGANSFQSGIGLISGWVCEAEAVELAIGAAGRARRGVWDGAAGHARCLRRHQQRLWAAVQLEPAGRGGTYSGGAGGRGGVGPRHGAGDDAGGGVSGRRRRGVCGGRLPHAGRDGHPGMAADEPELCDYGRGLSGARQRGPGWAAPGRSSPWCISR